MRRALGVVVVSMLGTACSFSFSIGNPEAIRGDPEFGDVVLATRVDDVSKEPLDDVTQFSSDVEELHAAINVKNMRAGEEFRFRWKRGTEVLTTLIFTVPVDLHDNWVEGFIEPTEPIPPGDDYSVQVLFNDDIVSEKSFRVVE